MKMLLLALAVMFAAGAGPLQAQHHPDFVLGAQVYGGEKAGHPPHNVRAPNERNDEDWQTIVLHMRMRAGMTGPEARGLLYFLQVTNGIAPDTMSTLTRITGIGGPIRARGHHGF